MFDVFHSVYADAPGLSFETSEDHIAASLYFECRTFLSGLLLVGDKLAMASGLEERFPFLDNPWSISRCVCRCAISLPISNIC